MMVVSQSFLVYIGEKLSLRNVLEIKKNVLKTDTIDEAFIYSVCATVFKHKDDLNLHMNMHTCPKSTCERCLDYAIKMLFTNR